MTKQVLQIAELTNGQPFCAGVVIRQAGNVLVTLNPDGLPLEWETSAYRLGGVGGGQEIGETLWECAIREGREELDSEVRLVSAPLTYFHDLDTGELVQVDVRDEIKPLLLERMTNPKPDKPYKPGLPTGPYLYFGLFLADLAGDHDIRPGDDVQGLLWLPGDAWSEVAAGHSVQRLIEQGATLIDRDDFDPSRRIFVPEDESFATVFQLLKRHPELSR
ncbi:MAG: NUDIX domain-containing protein [Tumebacillaceae bacterium]